MTFLSTREEILKHNKADAWLHKWDLI